MNENEGLQEMNEVPETPEEVVGEQEQESEGQTNDGDTPEPKYEMGDQTQPQPPRPEPVENAGFRRRREREKRQAEENRLLREKLENIERLIAKREAEGDPRETVNPKQELQELVAQSVEKSLYGILTENERQREEEEIARQREEEEIAVEEEKYLNQQCLTKLEQGHTRYKDFGDVLGNAGVKFTGGMEYALRSVEDPAALLYNSCKYHKADLDRISRMSDPVMQIAEMTRLNDRIMSRITPKTSSDAPEPVSSVRATSNDGGDSDYFSPGAIYERRNGRKYVD